MMEFLAANFNLPTIIVSIFVFGGTGWLLYHEHKTGGLGCCDGSCGGGGCGSHGGCTGNCKTCASASGETSVLCCARWWMASR